MIDDTNPAGRLHKILAKIKTKPDTTKVIDAWSEVIGCEATEVEVTRAVVALYMLSQEVQSLIKMNSSINEELYLKSFTRLERAFFPLNLNTNISNVKNQLTEEALTRLQFCAEELSKSYAEDFIDNSELEKILDLVNELYEQTRQSSMPDKLKLALLEELERVKHAIALYSIKGAKGIKESLQSLLGMAITNHDELTTVDEKEVLTKVGSLIDKIDSISSMALKVKAVSHKVGTLLGFSGIAG